jgi:gluconokinase
VIAARMAARAGHFMPLALLDSQFAALERLGPDETGVAVSIDAAADAVVAAALKGLREDCGWTDAAR